ncbi:MULTISPECIES: type II toxin-antitoxin system VapC family toxin [unclassified Methylobacterium]|jgi:ribonuclease VapC|uniref:type II toxin-antitoxin system VapC family toxin n=1 Tax=unclassified Methylobacterium TaxID=2615210 RepID=UPI001354E605|nr:type II toxin-antitoxin system VapC family toxin [Methylobacterium sp. 2A]MWV24230.1 type II toxin-antitoxin system VapC family toxin [Methylobacterium sp. 2A]
MIALDTSAIVAIFLMEAEAPEFRRIVARGPVCVGAPTLVETQIVLERRFGTRAVGAVHRFLTVGAISVVPFDQTLFEAAVAAFSRYGKGSGHPARLNFGDCLAYAVAKCRFLPLLYKGNDFNHTDLEAATG